METGDGEAYAQAGASGTGAPSAGAGGGEHVVRDRDPPPIYDGESPESTFRQFEKAVRLWEFESDIPAKKRGAKLVRALVGAAKLATEDLEFEAITAEDGVKNVMSRLREFFQPHLEVSLPRAFEAAVYGQQKQPKESFIEYIARAERNFQNLKKEGVELPAGAQGYILYRQAGLTEAQDQKILTWSEGKYDRALIISGLRRLDKVIKEKGKANYFEQTENVAAETFHQEANELEETDEEYVYVTDGDLDPIYEESEMQEALASYREVRQALRDQRNGRGYFPQRFKEGKSGKFGGKGGGKNGGKQRVHIEQLKLRTRCNRCGQVGHWARECHAPDRRQQGGASSNSSTTSSSGAPSQKTGFFVVSDPTAQGEQRSFWLKKFAASGQVSPAASREESDVSESYKVRSGEPFCGIVTQDCDGVVDTAAEGGLVGSLALERLQKKLQSRGMKCSWTSKTASAKGVGGQAKSLGVILIPLGIGKVNGVLECTVIEGDVPLLLPVSLMKTLCAKIDFSNYMFTIPSKKLLFENDIQIPMKEMPSGHVTIDITDFAEGKFQVPPECGLQHEFDLNLDSQAMMVQRFSDQSQFVAFTNDRVQSYRHAGHPGANQISGSAGSGDTHGGRRGSWLGSSSPQTCTTKLEGDHGQALYAPDFGSFARCYRRMGCVAFGATLIQCFGGGFDNAGSISTADCNGITFGTAEVKQGEAEGGYQQLSSPEGRVEGRWQWEPVLHRVQDVSCSVVKSYLGYGAKNTAEEGEEGGSSGPKAEGEGGAQHAVHLVDPRGRGEADQGGAVPREPEDGGVGAADVPRHRGDEAQGRRFQREDDGGPKCDELGSIVSRGECSSPCGAGAMSVQTASGVAEGEERRTSTRASVLEMHPEDMQLFPMGATGTDGAQSRAKEEQEPQEIEWVDDPKQLAERDHDPGRVGGRSSIGPRGLRNMGLWRSCSEIEEARWCRELQVKSDRGSNSFFHAPMIFEEWSVEKELWEQREGLVPIDPSRQVRVMISMTDRAVGEDVLEDGKTTMFTSKQRKAIVEAFNSQAVVKGGRKNICEVFSPPRVVEQAKKFGFGRGTSFDLETGWDLSNEEDVKMMWMKPEEESPLLIVICPPCTAFSRLQEWNFRRMEFGKAVSLLRVGLQHMHLAVQIMEWQHRRGGLFVFEQPHGARSWNEPDLVRLAEKHWRSRCDMCEFGMNVDGSGLNLKPTGVLTNSEEIFKEMSRRCSQNHQHTPVLHGLPKLAQKYPVEFCKAMVRGLKKQLRRDAGREVSSRAWVAEDIEVEDREGEEVQLEDAGVGIPAGFDPDRGEAEGDCGVSGADKKAVMKLHRATGHPQKPELIRFMRAARVRSSVVRWAQQNFRCEVCEAHAKPKVPRVSTIPKSYQPNKVLGIDLVYIPEVGVAGGGTFPALNMLDWGTCYQMVERVSSKSPEEIWHALVTTWFRTFGTPEVIVTDPGREFAAEFSKKAAATGIIIYQTAARAPWQQGRTERHGALFKELLEKCRSEVVVTDQMELKTLMMEVEQSKNRYSNRSGFAPVQRQIGQWPRVPSQIMSDDVLEPQLLDGMMVDDIERLHEMRRIAQKAFVEHNAKDTLKRALKAKSSVTPILTAGDYVYVYRVPRARKRKIGGAEAAEKGAGKPMWVGPGTVLVVEGASIWVSMLGELWRVAREQCRLATNEEKLGVEVVLQECGELIEEYKRNPHRAGYKDLREEGRPIEDAEETGFDKEFAREELEQKRRRREVVFDDMEDVIPTSPETEEIARVEDRRLSVEEPEVEVIGGSSLAPSQASEETMESLGLGDELDNSAQPPQILQPPSTQQHSGGSTSSAPDPEWEEAVRRSQTMSNRLDGHTGPLRVRRRAGVDNPYWVEVCGNELEDFLEMQEEEEKQRTNRLLQEASRARGKDYWEMNWETGELVRHHLKRRKMRYQPGGLGGTPFRSEDLEPERHTSVQFTKPGGEVSKKEKDSWLQHSGACERDWWKGTTTFFVTKEALKQREGQEFSVLATEKKGQDTVNLQEENEESRGEWKKADKAEWDKIMGGSAVRMLTLEESRKVRRELKEQRKENRILPTKIARRYKPAELPGQPPTRKSRLCIRGDKDPDILQLERFSPTINTLNFNLLLQTAANEGMKASVADFSNAFCQSKPLNRPNGELYFSLPPEGVEGVHPEQIVLIINGVYGLVDAPLHWRKTLVEELHQLNYFESRLDPCIFKWHDPATGKLLGAVAVEVDDLFMVGGAKHEEKMEDLRRRYKFGKWIKLEEEKEGCSFNGRRIRHKEGTFLIDMEKFIEERLNYIEIRKGRASQKKEEADEDEVSAARAACGALNWLSKEGRPDAAGPSSLLASKLASLKVEDLYHINDAIKQLKEKSRLAIQIQPLRNMRLSVVTDASFANCGFHSQGGHVLIAHEADLRSGKATKTNVISWRSGKLQRVVNSTLAAETQSLSRGLADLLWAMVTLQEFVDGKFILHKWPERLSGSEAIALIGAKSDKTLKESLAIVDAKSLFDYLSKETVGGQDKRTAIEVQIIREDLNAIAAEVRWVDHPAMLADGMTKLKGSNGALYRVLETGIFSIQEEMEHLKARQEARAQGQSNSMIRHSGVKEKGGDVKSESSFIRGCCLSKDS